MKPIKLNLGPTVYPLDPREANVLLDELNASLAGPAKALAAKIRMELRRDRPAGIRLGLDDIAALRNVLAGTNTRATLPGLARLLAALS